MPLIAENPSPASVAPRAARRAKPRCEHCGAPVRGEERFCCGGCAFVARLIREEGLDAYYKIKDTVTAPADSALRPAGDFGWLTDAALAAETATEPGRAVELELAVQGVSCAACVWLIERLFQRRPGAGDITVAAEAGRMRLRWRRGEFDAAEFARELQRFGYLIGPAGAAEEGEAGEAEARALARKTGLAAALAMNTMLFALPAYFGMSPDFEYARLFDTLAMGFATLAVFACGAYFLARAGRALRERVPHLDLPIALGIIGAYLGSVYGWVTHNPECQYFDFVSAFITLMLAGRWAQVAAVERNRRRLLREQPASAKVRVWRDHAWVESVPETLAAGERFQLGAGALVPVEARLEHADAEFALAWITGEPEPRRFSTGQRVPAGAAHAGAGRVELTAMQAWAGSMLAELLQPVERAPERTRLIERVVRAYLVGILGAAFLAGVWWAWRTGNAEQTGAVVISILVVSCPCALGLAFPLAEEIATVRLRRRGVFVRAGELWQRLARVRTVVFDKTGTLTGDTPVLRDPEALDRLDVEQRAALLGLVRDNPHPVGRALHEALILRGVGEALEGKVKEEVGRGVRLGSWVLERGEGGEGDTVLRHAGRVVASFRFAERARIDAADELDALRARRLELAILSGDRADKVSALATELGVPSARALGELGPREKAAWLDAHGGDTALMLGDGANDSLAFDHALCRGTPAVHRGVLATKADFYYLGRGLGGVRA
ncbi:MAG: heavy metal translocating P-type ATPase metal-binding domain-containing protein, partial [Opitutaceae bacterium]|nr:heavy metal translocating P-type ATPase metal-binding domain-containing protein [Opitutaceae bacterium]